MGGGGGGVTSALGGLPYKYMLKQSPWLFQIKSGLIKVLSDWSLNIPGDHWMGLT